MAVTKSQKVDDAVQKNINMVVDFLNKIHSRRTDTTNKLFALQKQDAEFEKLLQVSLLKLLAVHEFTSAGVLDKQTKPVKLPIENENRAGYG